MSAGPLQTFRPVPHGWNDCARHYDPKTGTNFARCPGTTVEVGMQGTGGAGGDSGGGATGRSVELGGEGGVSLLS